MLKLCLLVGFTAVKRADDCFLVTQLLLTSLALSSSGTSVCSRLVGEAEQVIGRNKVYTRLAPWQIDNGFFWDWRVFRVNTLQTLQMSLPDSPPQRHLSVFRSWELPGSSVGEGEVSAEC